MPDCPDWTQPESNEKLYSVVRGLEEVRRFISRKARGHVILHGDLKNWHERLFREAVPLDYYAGNYRSDDGRYPCLQKDVHVGGRPGAHYKDVPRLMAEFSNEFVGAVESTDSFLSRGPSPTERARAVVQLAAFGMGKLIQIHPFLNGNGRISRLIANYVFRRYGYPLPYYQPYARPGGAYAPACEACMSGDFNPLYRYLLSVVASR